jgi:transcriptional regulator with PAS, ATPase and Fis domain
MDNALQGRSTSNYELEFRTKSNEIRHLLVNATTRRDVENNVVGVVGVAQDVTEAVQRDRAVAGMANELRQLIDTANAPIFGIDCEGNVNEWYVIFVSTSQDKKQDDNTNSFIPRFSGTIKLPKLLDISRKRLSMNRWCQHLLPPRLGNPFRKSWIGGCKDTKQRTTN